MAGFTDSAVWRFIAESLVRSTLVLGAAYVLAVIFRRRSAALGHFILAVSLIGLLLVPVFYVIPGGWSTGLPGIGPFPPNPHLAIPVSIEEHRAGRVTADAHVSAVPLLGASEAADWQRSAPMNGSVSQKSAFPTRVVPYLNVVWALGALIILLRLGAGLHLASRLTREGHPVVGSGWRVLIDRFLAVVPLRRIVRLKSHPRIAVPLTWGALRPVVLLPEGAEGWSEDERSMALYHEFAHVKRADFLVMVLVRLSMALYWLNPLTWIALRALRGEQEKACDELVLRAGIKPSAYAACLLRFRRGTARIWTPSVALLGLFGRPQLNDRLSAILKHKLTSTEVKMKTKSMLVVLMFLIVGLVGMARPSRPIDTRAYHSNLNEETAVPRMPQPVWASEEAAAAPQTAPSETASVQDTEQEKEQEKEKEKDKKAEPESEKKVVKKIVIEPSAENKGQVEIIITDPKGTRKIIADKSVVLVRADKGDKKDYFILNGKTINLTEGTTCVVKIKDGTWTIRKNGDLIKLDKGQTYHLEIRTAEPGEEILGLAVPHVEKGEEKAEAREFVIVKPIEEKAETARFIVREDDLQKKLQAIREQLKLVKEKKLDIEEVDRSLAELEKSLEKHTVDLEKGVPLAVAEPKEFIIVNKRAAAKTEKVFASAVQEGALTLVVKDKDGLSIEIQAQTVEDGKERLEKAVNKIKAALPAGFTVDSELKEQSGAAKITIKGPQVEESQREALLKKIIDIAKEELKGESPKAK